MLGSAHVVAFVATTDPAAARTFYGDVLGLTLVDDSPFAVVFDANGTAVRVTVVPEAVIAPYTVLGWTVDDVEASIAALVAKGVTFERYDGLEQDELGIWTVPGGGARVAWFKDPEGNVLSLTQVG